MVPSLNHIILNVFEDLAHVYVWDFPYLCLCTDVLVHFFPIVRRSALDFLGKTNEPGDNLVGTRLRVKNVK